MGLTIWSRLLGSAIFQPGYHVSWESVAVFGIVFTSTSNRWNCDRLRRLRERSTRHRRHRAIFSSISDLNAPICALILSAFCWTVLALACLSSTNFQVFAL